MEKTLLYQLYFVIAIFFIVFPVSAEPLPGPNVIKEMPGLAIVGGTIADGPGKEDNIPKEMMLPSPAVNPDLNPKEAVIANSVGVISALPDEWIAERNGWACTAFCIADHVIATNAHCLTKAKGGRQPALNDIIFFRGDIQFSAKSGKFVPMMITRSKLRNVDDKNPHLAIYSGYDFRRESVARFSADWAFAKLETPICEGHNLTFRSVKKDELIKAGDKYKIYMIAQDFQIGFLHPTVSRFCSIFSNSDHKKYPRRLRRILRRNKGIVVHDCASRLGSSGSPLLMNTEEGIYVVAINAGAITSKERKVIKRERVGRYIKLTYTETDIVYKSAVHPDAFVDGIERLLNSLEEFKEVQTHLRERGLYRGAIDGLLGPKTKRALIRYEENAGLTPIGMPTQRLLSLLRGVSEADLDPVGTQ